MPPKAQFSREQILDAAFAMVQEQGLERLTARGLAKRLGCSTSPIYSAYATMQQLEDDICQRSVELMLQYQTQDRIGSPLVDLCLGYLLFAREHRQLFRDMFLNKQEISQHGLQMRAMAYEQIMSKMANREPALRGVGPEKALELIQIIMTYTHGLAMQTCMGAQCLPDQPALVERLRRVIEALLANLPRA